MAPVRDAEGMDTHPHSNEEKNMTFKSSEMRIVAAAAPTKKPSLSFSLCGIALTHCRAAVERAA